MQLLTTASNINEVVIQLSHYLNHLPIYSNQMQIVFTWLKHCMVTSHQVIYVKGRLSSAETM